VHSFGQVARERVEDARDRVAALIGARPPELVFTASGTEANNAVVFSCGRLAGWRGHLVISAFEHPSVLAAAERAAAEGMTVTRVSPDSDGRVDTAAILAAVGEDTRLVCLMLANNEIGTLQPVAEVAAGCRERGVPMLCDAVQAVGKIGVRVGELGVDYLTLGAHKLYGPLGAAALWVRGGADLEPLLVGGGQERRRRAGTVNLPAVAGLGKAAELAAAELDERRTRTARLRDRFEAEVGGFGDVLFHGRRVARLPNTSNLAFAGIDAEALLIRLDLDGFAVSTGSACAAGAVEPSGALLAMGLSRAEALSSLRVSFGPTNDDEEVSAFLGALERQLVDLRRLATA
jgi:cysteine desulfurase